MTASGDPRARLITHTVEIETAGRKVLTGGFLVRAAATARDIGWIWKAGSGSWNWRTPDGTHYGERSSLPAASRVLADIADHRDREASRAAAQHAPQAARAAAQPMTPKPRDMRAASQPASRASQPAAQPTPQPAARIVWADLDAGSLRDAIARQLDKHR